MFLRNVLVLSLASAFIAAVGCADPVHSDAIAALGSEQGSAGPEHRPGQPCVLCHSKDGPASGSPFAVGGTIYTTSAGTTGAEGLTVQFIDARGGAPLVNPKTNKAGNFWVLASDWPDIAFPLRVGVYQNPSSAPTQAMQSLIGREGSCNFCHRAFNTGNNLTQQQVIENQSSQGPIYSGTGS